MIGLYAQGRGDELPDNPCRIIVRKRPEPAPAQGRRWIVREAEFSDPDDPKVWMEFPEKSYLVVVRELKPITEAELERLHWQVFAPAVYAHRNSGDIAPNVAGIIAVLRDLGLLKAAGLEVL